MLKNNGFTLIEVLVATSILMVAVSVIVPIIVLLNEEQQILSDRRVLAYRLHDELQPYIWEENLSSPSLFHETIQNKNATFHFTKENDYIKGCVTWENVKKKDESFCLYGLPQK
ncbi:type II secretion system protein [Virgibacillus profundi]|uniref:type II secretion system protein n=1 Tax=Virgibacillus profundi TaxID=2024555 RepID=UPI0013FDFA2F|nr:type II secretion system protein [Virgibacillus profundi]